MSSLLPILAVFLAAWFALPAMRKIVYTYIADVKQEYDQHLKQVREAKRIAEMLKKE